MSRTQAKIKEEEVIEGEEIRKVWDLKKIVVGLIIMTTVLILGSYLFVPQYAGETDQKRQALGVSTSDTVPPLPDKEDIDTVLNNAQEALSNISSENLTSSQAAIQKIITDLQGLQNSDGVGDLICSVVCGK